MLTTSDSSSNQTFSTLIPSILSPYPTESDCINTDPDAVNFYRFITNGLFINIIGMLGLLGNIISIVILSRPQMRSSINYLLIGLAGIDAVLILTSILLFGLPGIYPYSGCMFTYYYTVYPHIVPVVFPVAMVTQTASVYVTLTVSLERFVAVCHPLRARSLCTYGRARIYVIGIIIFSAMYNLPKFWEASVQKEWSEEHNVTVYCPRQASFRDNPLYKTIYIHWLYLICMYLLPFGSLVVLNACIYRQVLKANKERQRLSPLQKREIGLATMLLGVVAVFFVCNFLPLVINIIETFDVPIDFDLIYLINTSNLLVTLNSSVNFIIYVIFGEKFKRLFLILFCHNSFLGTGRESPDEVTHEESLSKGDRQSPRKRLDNEINEVTKRNRSCINATEMRFLRKIEGKTRRDRIRNETNKKKLKIKKDKGTQEKQLDRLGHVYRMSEDRLYRRGRPRKTWQDEVKQTTHERNIQWLNIKDLVQNRKIWKENI